MKTTILLTILTLAISNVFAQPIPVDSMYLGQTKPGTTPKIFKLAATSGLFCGERVAFSADGTMVYYSELDKYPVSKSRSKYYKYSDNKWNGPFILFENLIAPTFSITGDTMYLEKFPPNDIRETYLSAKTGSSWGTPKRILKKLGFTHNFQVTNNGKLHILANSSTSIGKSDWSLLKITGTDTTVVSLGLPINTIGNDGDYFVAKDESYMILNIDQGGGNWGLFVTYKKNDGTWTKPKNMGKTVNFANSSWGPYVTSDKKYMFFTAGFKADYSDTYTYWMKVDNLLDSLKTTNYAPYLKTPITAKSDSVGKQFSYTFPENTFIDDDGNNTLTYTATLSTNAALPTWLSFDAATRTLSGTPTAAATYTIKITATDAANASATATFNLTIHPRLIIESLSGKYMGQTPPGSTAVIFAHGGISKPVSYEHDITFSADAKEMFYTVSSKDWTNFTIYTSKEVNGFWTKPAIADFLKTSKNTEIVYSPDGKRLLFSTDAAPGSSTNWNHTIFQVEKDGSGWSNPRDLGLKSLLPSDGIWHPGITADSSVYFSSYNLPQGKGLYDIYLSNNNKGTYTGYESLGAPINTTFDDLYPWIAPNDSFLIFSSNRTGGFGDHDLYITYKKSNGEWTNPKNLGSKINSNKSDASPRVTIDGKYLFHTRMSKTNWDGDIYWTNTSFIDSLHRTNFAPYLKTAILAQSDSVGKQFSYTFPENTFIDDDGNNTLTYTATLSTNAVLPSWLSFNAATRTLSGIPTTATTYAIKITAKDAASASASATFNINIRPSATVSISENGKTSVAIYPNPSSGIFYIKLDELSAQNAKVEISDFSGKLILFKALEDGIIDLTGYSKGVYVAKITIGDEMITEKLVIK